MEGRDASITAVTEAKPRKTALFYKPFKDDARRAAGEAAELRAAGRCKAIREAVQPAYVELLKFLRDEYVPGMRDHARGRGPAGRQSYYRAEDPRIHHPRHGSRRDPPDSALPKWRSSTPQMLAVMKETGFKGDFPAFQSFLRTDPRSTRRRRRSC